MIELVVAAGLLLVAMSFVVQMTYRVDHLWTDAAEHRVAMHELSNQVERLSLLSVDEVSRQLESLEIAANVTTILRDAAVSGELVEDDFGKRLVLRLNWSRRHAGEPLQMVGWMMNSGDER